jgi:AraC family transcriptional regulator, transcriptional activator of the genes for pyochelin and ferripyochelin receptors
MPMMVGDEKGNWEDLGGNFLEALPSAGSTSVTEQYKEFSFSCGNVQMNYLALAGIFIVYGDIKLFREYLRVQRYDAPDTVELHFSLSGACTVNNFATGHRHTFADNCHSMVFLPEIDGTVNYRPYRANKMFEIHFTSSYFTSLAAGVNGTLEGFAESLHNKRSACLHEPGLPITAAMHACIHDIMHCGFKGAYKHLFLQAKSIELLSLQAEAFEQAAHTKPSSVLRSAYDRDCIMQAKEYLLQHMHQPPTLQDLATVVGTNVFKLKNGFKELFDNTVFGYLNDVKLGHAKELLLSGQPIKEVSDQLGYSSVQHFGSAFRKKFGTTPGKLRL